MIRAKFIAHLLMSTPYSDGRPCERVELHAVYSPDPEHENYSWSQATPTGDISLVITNPDAIGQFQEGKEYFVDFTPVEAEAPAEAPSEAEALAETGNSADNEPPVEPAPTAEVEEPLHESGSSAEAEAVPEPSPTPAAEKPLDVDAGLGETSQVVEGITDTAPVELPSAMEPSEPQPADWSDGVPDDKDAAAG